MNTPNQNSPKPEWVKPELIRVGETNAEGKLFASTIELTFPSFGLGPS